MPVEVAPLDELTPFFTYLKQGKAAAEECVEFVRGAYYNDGRIDMCKQVVGSDWISELVDSVKSNANVKHFLLGNNIVGDRRSLVTEYNIVRFVLCTVSILYPRNSHSKNYPLFSQKCKTAMGNGTC